MFERPQSGEAAILVHVNFATEDEVEHLQEFQELVFAAGAKVLTVFTTSRHVPEAKYFIGSGKAAEIAEFVAAKKAGLVIFNHPLSPAQERNLENLFKCRVVDRIGLILDIFAQRARTFEGKLQVELAQLQHMSTRLVRGWSHLERQKGGIGLRGPGETQLETDRRLLRARMKSIGKRLEKVRLQRDQGRRARLKSAIPTLSLVGYTNAGKSTLFNLLTGSDVFVANQLFATLDPTLRRVELPGLGEVVLADTVGFIRHLPHELIDAFRATLEETLDATLLLHVVDASSDERFDQIAQVTQVLQQIGATYIPQLIVYNKIDLINESTPRIERDEEGHAQRVWISAVKGLGIDLLQSAIKEYLRPEWITGVITLFPHQGRLRGYLYSLGVIMSEQVDDNGNWILEVHMPKLEYERLLVSKA